MKFIFFFRGPATPDPDQFSAWTKTLQRQGHWIDGALLIQDGKIVLKNTIRDFVFNVHENASGYMIISAENLEEAIIISKNCPILTDGGHVTIRPIITPM